MYSSTNFIVYKDNKMKKQILLFCLNEMTIKTHHILGTIHISNQYIVEEEVINVREYRRCNQE